jgi:hypothetical protein
MRTITLEEHFAHPGFLEGPGRELKDRALRTGGAASTVLEQLCDLGEKPYASMTQALAFLDQLPVSTADKERIACGNAERLFGL